MCVVLLFLFLAFGDVVPALNGCFLLIPLGTLIFGARVLLPRGDGIFENDFSWST